MKQTWISIACVTILAWGCATAKPLTKPELIEKYDFIGDLDKQLTTAKQSDVNLLAPAGYSRAEELLAEAIEKAQKAEEKQAKTVAFDGLSVLSSAESDSEQSREIMWEVLEYRARARKAGAPVVFKSEFESLEGRLRDANQMVERDNFEGAKKRRPDLIKGYSDLEIKTLKEGTIAVAKAAFKQAESMGADNHAPKTLGNAERELNLAITTLEADLSQVDEANTYAKTAKRLSKEAEQITELARIFDRRDYSYEDIILWYQQQLTEINRPLGTTLDFTQPNRKVVGSVHDSIASVLKSQKDDLGIIEKQQNYITELQAQIASQTKKYEEKEHREAEARQRFDYVQSLFTPEEAEVFRKGNDVLISVDGFYFPVGETIILPQNFGLMNKIINAIQQFPDSRIRISGHTDSIGPTEVNQKLSEERANNVAKFLLEVGNIHADRVQAEGYGESKPVASNKTEEGRAKNRRVEVYLINK